MGAGGRRSPCAATLAPKRFALARAAVARLGARPPTEAALSFSSGCREAFSDSRLSMDNAIKNKARQSSTVVADVGSSRYLYPKFCTCHTWAYGSSSALPAAEGPKVNTSPKFKIGAPTGVRRCLLDPDPPAASAAQDAARARQRFGW